MTGLRIALQTSCLRQPLRKALNNTAQIGCEGVEIDARSELRPAEMSGTALRQLRKILADLNLRIAAVTFPTRRGYSDPDQLQARVEATLAAMQLASQLKARVLVCYLGSLPEQQSSPDRATLMDVLATLSAQGNRLGVQIAARTEAADLSNLKDLFAQLPEQALGLDFNPARLIDQEILPAHFLAELGQHVVHVHATDGVPDLASGRSTEVELGRGTADYPELLGLLEEHAYRDWLTVGRHDAQQPLEEAGNAVQYLRAL